MKKRAKVKVAKSSSKRSAAVAPEPELPSLVTAMTKLVERLEALELKTDQVLSRVSNLPAEIRNTIQQPQRPNLPQHTQSPQRPDHAPAHGHADGRRERVMHQAVCADCKKNCEVPFRPTEERPVYCKECFAIRKAGHAPQAPDSRRAFHPQKKARHNPRPMNFSPQGSAAPSGSFTISKSGKLKPARHDGSKPKKKR